MKLLIKSYSNSVVVVVTVIALLVIMTVVTVGGNTGIQSIFGNIVNVNNADYAGYEAAAAKAQDILSGEPVQIVYDDTAGRICTGEDVYILSYFSVVKEGNTENAQNVEKVKILSVKGNDGNETAYDAANRTVKFENPGLYVVRLSVRDSENRQSVADVTVPVEE